MNWLRGFFNGGNSSMRLVLVIPNILVWTTWTYLSWKHQVMQDMPVTIAATLAATVFGKAVQAVAEKKQVSTSESSTVTTKSESVPVPTTQE